MAEEGHHLHLIVELMNEQRQDQEIAEGIKAKLGENPDVTQVIVKGKLLQIHVTESLYNRMSLDRERGRKIVLSLMQSMKTLTSSSDVTVWVYCNNEKMIEGKVKQWGGDNVMYVYDL